jgi:hypothetical protein
MKIEIDQLDLFVDFKSQLSYDSWEQYLYPKSINYNIKTFYQEDCFSNLDLYNSKVCKKLSLFSKH